VYMVKGKKGSGCRRTKLRKRLMEPFAREDFRKKNLSDFESTIFDDGRKKDKTFPHPRYKGVEKHDDRKRRVELFRWGKKTPTIRRWVTDPEKSVVKREVAIGSSKKEIVRSITLKQGKEKAAIRSPDLSDEVKLAKNLNLSAPRVRKRQWD